MELSVDHRWIIFQITQDMNNYFKNLLLEVCKIQFHIAFINKSF